MFYQGKQAIVSLISTILISAGYCMYVFQKYAAEGGAANEFHFWASAILLFIPVSVVCKIVIYIAFAIINIIATNEKEPSITDELDRLIELKATRNFYHLFMAGFLLAMAALVLGLPPVAMFTILLFSMIAAGVMLDLSQVYFYWRGI